MAKRPTDTEAIEELRKLLPVGSTIHTVLRRVSSGGMSREISLHVLGIRNGAPFIRDITWLASRVLGYRIGDNGGLKVSGAGMDMGFHVVYSLSSMLYHDGHKCTGSNGWAEEPSEANNYEGKPSKTHRCPSNDHTNDFNYFSREYAEEHGEEYELNDRESRTAYCVARGAAFDATESKRYSKRRVHRDGGYAIGQTWL